MENVFFLRDIILVLAFAIPVIIIFHKIKVPSIIGFIISGIIIGPFGLKLIDKSDGINNIAEIGVALLLFTIGVEISLSKFRKLFKDLLLTGGLQVSVTILISTIISILLGFSLYTSIFIGFLLTHSSSAITMKLLNDNREINSAHGKISVGITVFQDLMIVPMFIFLPILTMSGKVDVYTVFSKLGFSVIIIILIVLLAKIILPKVLKLLVDLHLKDVFLIGVIVILLGTAYLTYSIGLSFAIGAFIAGLIISESDYSEEIISEIMPLKDVFMSLFFISLGMLLDLQFLSKNPMIVIEYSILIIITKFSVIFIAMLIVGYSSRISFISGIILAQIGEFSFILATAGLNQNLIPDDLFKGIIASSIFTLLISPIFFKYAATISKYIPELKKPKTVQENEEINKNINHHVIIVGYGLNGRNLVQVLKETGIKYVILEVNPNIFNKAKKDGENIIYGDTTNEQVLRIAGIESAKVVVFAISDPISVKMGVKLAKQMNPNIFIIVRTLYIEEVDNLIKLGADDVIPEEFETSIQIFNRVLRYYHIPQSIIYTQSSIIRNQAYNLLRNIKTHVPSFDQIEKILAQGTIDVIYVDRNCKYKNKSLTELDLRNKFGINVISIVRNNENINNPSGNTVIQENDQLIIFGNHISIDNTVEFFNSINC